MGGVDSDARLDVVRRGVDLFNAGDRDVFFSAIFHPDVDYSGDPEVSALTGFPVHARGVEHVRAVWDAFFAMFDRVQLSDVELELGEGDVVLGRGHMVSRGGESEVPIDATFHFAWRVSDGRWRFMAVKRHEDEVSAVVRSWP